MAQAGKLDYFDTQDDMSSYKNPPVRSKSRGRSSRSKDQSRNSKDRSSSSKDRTSNSNDRTSGSKDRTSSSKDRTSSSKDRSSGLKNASSSVSNCSDQELPVAFSGFIHVCCTKKELKHPKFKKRYCKLRDVVCKFYDNKSEKANDYDKHMIMSVMPIPHVNHGMQLMTHKNEILYLYTEIAEDYDLWFNAFDEGILSAQRSKAVRSRSVKNLPMGDSPDDKLAKKKLYKTYSNLSRSSSDSSKVTISKHGWLHLITPKLLFGTSAKRRFFRLYGNDLSYFDVNMEGRQAEGNGKVHAVKLASEPLQLDVTVEDGKVLRLQAKTDTELLEWKNVLESSASIANVNQDKI